MISTNANSLACRHLTVQVLAGIKLAEDQQLSRELIAQVAPPLTRVIVDAAVFGEATASDHVRSEQILFDVNRSCIAKR